MSAVDRESFVPVFLPVRDCPVFLTVVIAMDVP